MWIFFLFFLFCIHADRRKKKIKKSISNGIVTKFEQKTFARAAARKGSHTHTHTSLKLAPSQEARLTFGCIKVLMKPCCSAQTQTHAPAVFATRVPPRRAWPRCHDFKGWSNDSLSVVLAYVKCFQVSSRPLGGPKNLPHTGENETSDVRYTRGQIASKTNRWCCRYRKDISHQI